VTKRSTFRAEADGEIDRPPDHAAQGIPRLMGKKLHRYRVSGVFSHDHGMACSTASAACGRAATAYSARGYCPATDDDSEGAAAATSCYTPRLCRACSTDGNSWSFGRLVVLRWQFLWHAH
jgi:hypothetical protein